MNNGDADNGQGLVYVCLCATYFVTHCQSKLFFFCVCKSYEIFYVNIYDICVFTVGKLWTRSQKLAYTLLNKLSTRNEPLLVPGDRVSHDI